MIYRMRVLSQEALDLEETSKKRFDDDRFLRLLMDSQHRVYAFILASVHSISDADDIMQSVSTVMWRRFGEYDSGSNFTAWGIGISRKLILNFYSKKKKVRVHFDNKTLESLEAIACSKLDEADRRVEFLRKCINKLSEAERKLVDLRYGRSLKTNTIANMVGLSVSRTYRAMAKIHVVLQKCIRRTMREEGLI